MRGVLASVDVVHEANEPSLPLLTCDSFLEKGGCLVFRQGWNLEVIVK